MRKMIAGLAAGLCLAVGGVASADCMNCDDYDVNLNVNGNPFYGKWAIVDDRPYVGIEALSDALNLPRKHNYKAWNMDRKGMSGGDPLTLMTQTKNGKVDTIRFAGVTMVDLYQVAANLRMPVHHNFNNKTIQVGKNYNGEIMKGKWYRYLSRARGWNLETDLDRCRDKTRTPIRRDMEWDDAPREKSRL